MNKWQEREDNSLNPFLTNRLGEGEGEQRERGEREEKESF